MGGKTVNLPEKKPKKPEHNREPIALPKPTNGYYEAVSERFGIAQMILYLLLLAFVIASLLGNTGMITYQNLYYFIKDLNASAETVDVLHSDSLSYPADTSQSFALYRKGLAVAGSSSVTVFTATGREAISLHVQYQNPVAIGSGKYLMVYELGGTQYSLYNSYTKIYSGRTQSPIRGAEMSPNGMYALITSGTEHASVVDLYNSDFKQNGRYSYNGYVTDVGINEKGNRLAILISEEQGAAFSTSLRIYETGKSELTSNAQIGDGLGLTCAFTESGGITVLSSNGISHVRADGGVTVLQSFDANRLSYADLNADGGAIVLKNNEKLSENEILAFDKNGKLLYNETVEKTVESVALKGHMLFLKEKHGILRIDLRNRAITEYPCATDGKTLLCIDEHRVLLCSTQKAVSYTLSQ